MKPFHIWCADMENSIEDASTVTKTPQLQKNGGNKKRSEWQIRRDMADLVVQVVDDPDSCIDWMDVFCCEFNTCLGKPIFGSVETVLGSDLSKEYYENNDDETLEWHIKFYNSIEERDE